MKKHIRRILFFLFISSCPLIATTVLWMLTFGQVFGFIDAISSGFYVIVTTLAIVFASVVAVSIDDQDIPL